MPPSSAARLPMYASPSGSIRPRAAVRAHTGRGPERYRSITMYSVGTFCSVLLRRAG